MMNRQLLLACLFAPVCFPVMIIVAALGIISGTFFFLKPFKAIELQKKFYETINWRIEPISMPKEIRNTKFIGVIILAASLFAIVRFCR